MTSPISGSAAGRRQRPGHSLPGNRGGDLIMGSGYDPSPSEIQAVIHEEINRLPAAYRTAVILCGLEGRSLEWAARELRWPVLRLERRLARALECLRFRLTRRGWSVPAETWDCAALRDAGTILPRSLIESTVAAATGRPAPASGSRRPPDGSPRRWQDDPCGPRGWSATMPGEETPTEGPDRRLQGGVRELLARIKDGDEGAARELLTRYETKVRLVVRRQLPRLLRSRFDSLDFLQSVWGSFFHKIQTGQNDLDEEQNLIAFLAWAARNKVIDEYRHAATQKQDIHREERLEARSDKDICLAGGDTPSELAQAQETYDRLRDFLPENRRVILELKAAGYSSREIGDQLGISERTVQRVLEDLRVRARLED
jgi:RNA polymerase sigma-70 factor (ECF subfamily)